VAGCYQPEPGSPLSLQRGRAGPGRPCAARPRLPCRGPEPRAGQGLLGRIWPGGALFLDVAIAAVAASRLGVNFAVRGGGVRARGFSPCVFGSTQVVQTRPLARVEASTLRDPAQRGDKATQPYQSFTVWCELVSRPPKPSPFGAHTSFAPNPNNSHRRSQSAAQIRAKLFQRPASRAANYSEQPE
jgi:hypothetical protein